MSYKEGANYKFGSCRMFTGIHPKKPTPSLKLLLRNRFTLKFIDGCKSGIKTLYHTVRHIFEFSFIVA